MLLLTKTTTTTPLPLPLSLPLSVPIRGLHQEASEAYAPVEHLTTTIRQTGSMKAVFHSKSYFAWTGTTNWPMAGGIG